MTPNELDELLGAVARRETTPRTAIGRLVAAGLPEGEAEEMVHIALGGSDLIVVGEDGRERYDPSGRLVREVLAEMDR